jgi:hypothetical protein
MLGVAADFVTSLFTLGVVGASQVGGAASRFLEMCVDNEIDAAANAINAVEKV